MAITLTEGEVLAYLLADGGFTRNDDGTFNLAPQDAARPHGEWLAKTDVANVIQHARWMATCAQDLMDAHNARDLAVMILEEEEPSDELDAALESANENMSQSWDALRSALYEFHKRADRLLPKE